MAIVLYSAQKQAASFGLHPKEVTLEREQDPSRLEIMEGIDALLALAGSLEGKGRKRAPTLTNKSGELYTAKGLKTRRIGA